MGGRVWRVIILAPSFTLPEPGNLDRYQCVLRQGRRAIVALLIALGGAIAG